MLVLVEVDFTIVLSSAFKIWDCQVPEVSSKHGVGDWMTLLIIPTIPVGVTLNPVDPKQDSSMLVCPDKSNVSPTDGVL